MLKKLARSAARALGATSETDLLDRRMQEHVERPAKWIRQLEHEVLSDQSYQARHGRPRPE